MDRKVCRNSEIKLVFCILEKAVTPCLLKSLSKKWTATLFNNGYGGVISFCQAQTHELYLTISTYLPIQLQFRCVGVLFYKFGTKNQPKSFRVINKYYCTFQLMVIKSSIFARHSVRIQL